MSYKQPNNSFNASANSGAFICETCVIVAAHRAALIRALGCYALGIENAESVDVQDAPRCQSRDSLIRLGGRAHWFLSRKENRVRGLSHEQPNKRINRTRIERTFHLLRGLLAGYPRRYALLHTMMRIQLIRKIEMGTLLGSGIAATSAFLYDEGPWRWH